MNFISEVSQFEYEPIATSEMEWMKEKKSEENEIGSVLGI